MSRRGTLLLVLCTLVLAGCRGGGDKRAGDDKYSGPTPSGETTGRATGPTTGPTTNPDSPAHWLDRPKPNWMHGSTPPAATWKDPKSPDFNTKTDAAGLLAGYVEDPEGRKVGNVFIEVRESGDTNSKPIGVLSGASGAFNADGLKPNRNYQLTVNATVDGRKLFQTVYVKTPNPNVRLSLLESDGSMPAPSPAPAKSPAADKPADPPASVDPLKKPPTGDIPNPNGPLPVPKFSGAERDPGVNPVGGFDPPPPRDDALPKVDRYDLMTDQGPVPWKPPVANIPLPRVGQPIPSATPPTKGESRKQTFAFVDHTGKEAAVPTGKLTLMSFNTAGSTACVRAVPLLNTLHEKYADRGLVVVGVGCDDEPLSGRILAADLFRKDNAVKYPLLTEAGKKSGDLLKRYGVTELPAAVLLNASGEVVWQGNPNKPTGLVEAIEAGVH
jgi:peroxiredoxin